MPRTTPALIAVAGLALTGLAVAGPAAASTPVPPAYTSAQLDQAKTTLDSRLQKPPAGVTAWGVDPATGRVVVKVLAGDATALAAARQAVGDLPQATISTVKERPQKFYNLTGGDAIYAAGGGRCSIGFSAKAGGTTYVITAGHCTELGGSWSGYNRVTIGSVDRTSFPGDDFGTIRVSSSQWVGTAAVTGTSSVTGSTEAGIGAQVCRSGSTTGYHCGTVQAKGQTVNYGGGDIVYGLTETDACAEPGDSGGSFVAGRQAQGMTSGGSGDCSAGGTTYFQPVNEVLSRYGLTLVTA